MAKRNKISVILISSFLLCIIFAISASAEEMYTGHPIRWDVKNSSGYYLTNVNGDLLNSASSCYKDNIFQATHNWSNNTTEAVCNSSSYTDSDVDLETASSSWWNTFEGGGTGIVACTVQETESGILIYSANDVQSMQGYIHINYAVIAFNPTTPSNVAANDTYQLQTLVHEIGHVYGMGHTTTTNSIMYPVVSSITTLTSYDVNVMNSFYHTL